VNRRQFITLLGGAAAWPLAARAQQAAVPARIGVMRSARRSPATPRAWPAFFDALQAFGFTLDRNLIAEMRWVDEDARGPAAVAAELVQAGVEVLVVDGTEADLQAAVAASPHLPIVIWSNNYDPIARGYVASLARPGGRVTGVSIRGPEVTGKQVELLAQTFPERTRLAMLWSPRSADQHEAGRRAAELLRLQVQAYKLGEPPYDMDEAFGRLVEGAPQMLLIQSEPHFVPHAARIAQLAIQHRLPTMFIGRSYVDQGGLMSYGPHRLATLRLVGTYVGKILKGAKPADLPVEQPTTYELALNLRTAKAIGIELPTSILLRADEVIE
jgi:putative ABC transport system substrate-binding protein